MEKLFNYTHKPTSTELLEKIRQTIPKYVKGEKLNHIFFVEKEATAIAQKLFLVYNISGMYLNDIKAAALLHDLTKQLDLKAQLDLCDRFGISPDEPPSCAILHGRTAAYMARELFNINDYVFSAIFNHTTGAFNMGLFDKIIFIADYTEESRTYKSCIYVREFLHNALDDTGSLSLSDALDEAIIMSIDNTVNKLIEQGKIIHTDTILTRNSLIKAKD